MNVCEIVLEILRANSIVKGKKSNEVITVGKDSAIGEDHGDN